MVDAAAAVVGTLVVPYMLEWVLSLQQHTLLGTSCTMTPHPARLSPNSVIHMISQSSICMTHALPSQQAVLLTELYALS